MQCSVCHYPDSHVVRTDYDDLKNLVKRRRECMKCGYRFNTAESIKPKQYKTIPPLSVLPK